MTSYLALVMTLAIWSSPFVAFGIWLACDRRAQRRLRREAAAAVAAQPDNEIVEVRPHLYVVREPMAQVIDARERFAARRAVASHLGGGSAA
jgi:hypothetical protein